MVLGFQREAMVQAGAAFMALCVMGVVAQDRRVLMRRFFNTTIERSSSAETVSQPDADTYGPRLQSSTISDASTVLEATVTNHRAPQSESRRIAVDPTKTSSIWHDASSIDNSLQLTIPTTPPTISVYGPKSAMLGGGTPLGVINPNTSEIPLSSQPGTIMHAVDASSTLHHSFSETDALTSAEQPSTSLFRGGYIGISGSQRELSIIKTSGRGISDAVFPALETKGWEALTSVPPTSMDGPAASLSLSGVTAVTVLHGEHSIQDITANESEIRNSRASAYQTIDGAGYHASPSQEGWLTLDTSMSPTSTYGTRPNVDAFAAHDGAQQSAKQRATTAGIAVGVVGISAVFGGCLLILSRRYRRERNLRIRLPLDQALSRQSSLEIKCIGKPS